MSVKLNGRNIFFFFEKKLIISKFIQNSWLWAMNWNKWGKIISSFEFSREFFWRCFHTQKREAKPPTTLAIVRAAWKKTKKEKKNLRLNHVRQMEIPIDRNPLSTLSLEIRPLWEEIHIFPSEYYKITFSISRKIWWRAWMSRRERGENYDLFTINMVLITFFSLLKRSGKWKKRKFSFCLSVIFFFVIFLSSFATQHSSSSSSDALRCLPCWRSWDVSLNICRERVRRPFVGSASRKVVYWWHFHFQWTFVDNPHRRCVTQSNHDKPCEEEYNDVPHSTMQFDTQVTLQKQAMSRVAGKIAWKIFHFTNIVVVVEPFELGKILWIFTEDSRSCILSCVLK